MPACLQHGIRGSASSFKGSFRSLISCPVLSCFLSTVYRAGPLSGKDADYAEYVEVLYQPHLEVHSRMWYNST